MTQQERTQILLDCCHCERWAEAVSTGAPYASREALFSAAAEQWQKANETEILEAFEGHPQIGDLEALRNKYAVTASAEQGQVVDADEEVLLRLRDLNQTYLDRFGFIFIVCATGKSAKEMLSLLEARIDSSRDQELKNGAVEQGKIMQLRLQKLVGEIDG